MRTKINKTLVLAAAGSSTRIGLGKKKEYMRLGNGTVLSEAVKAFLKTDCFSTIVISVPKNGEKQAAEALYADPELKTLLKDSTLIFCEGGATRQESVFRALAKITEKNAIVLIHDAARPFITKEIIEDVIQATIKYGAAVPAVQPVDTQKEIADNGTISRHLKRKKLCSVQTPQGFLLEQILECHKKASENNCEYTDDTEIWDSFPELTGGRKVFIVNGSEKNKKITFAQDIIREEKMTRIGIGTDFHRLIEGRKLILGGVEIPSDKGELGHSDGDVLLHAISDALLGASGLGDIGSYFPPDDNKWKDADSMELLKKIWNDVKNSGWSLENLDTVIEIESPKFLPWRKKVIDSIAGILGTSPDNIFVKAKTNEQLDSVGEGLAVKAYCVCLLKK